VLAKLPIDDAEDFVIWLLDEFQVNGETVMGAPAEGFYATPGLGKNEIRLAYIINNDELVKAMEIFKAGIAEYIRIKS
jgi:aspartate aminotransferase